MCSDNFLCCCAADSNKPYIVQTIAKNNHGIENNERILTMGISNITLKVLFLGAFRLYLFDYWFLDHKESFINQGNLVEAFVGQEITAYMCPDIKKDLCYWHKDTAPQQAEIDYLLEIHKKVIPVEVKSGDGRTLRSIRYFLETHKNSPYGIRFFHHNYSEYDNIHSYPLYAIFKVMSDDNPDMKAAIAGLFA